jgi:hypothetical protein
MQRPIQKSLAKPRHVSVDQDGPASTGLARGPTSITTQKSQSTKRKYLAVWEKIVDAKRKALCEEVPETLTHEGRGERKGRCFNRGVFGDSRESSQLRPNTCPLKPKLPLEQFRSFQPEFQDETRSIVAG